MTDQGKLTDARYARIAPLLRPLSNHLKISHRQVLDAVLPGVDRTLVGGQAPRDIRQARVAGRLRFVVTGRVLVALVGVTE